jgi:hypothetical protein
LIIIQIFSLFLLTIIFSSTLGSGSLTGFGFGFGVGFGAAI